MAKTHHIHGIEYLPIYLICAGTPQTVSEDDFIDGVPLTELVTRIKPGDHLYLVDYASHPGYTRDCCTSR